MYRERRADGAEAHPAAPRRRDLPAGFVAAVKPLLVYGGPPFAHDGPLVPDPWQEKVGAAIARGDHVVVDAPTGAGKTWPCEEAIRMALAQGGRCCYTAPIKALANDKYRDFQQRFGAAQVGLHTGDVKLNTTAPLLVATLESWRNILVGEGALETADRETAGSPGARRWSLAIIDEYAMLADGERGIAYETTILIAAEAGVQLVLLSASVANGDQIAGWLGAVSNQPAVCIRDEQRPVELVQLVPSEAGLVDVVDEPALRQARRNYRLPPVAPGLDYLRLFEQDLCPALVMVGKRKAAQGLAQAIAHRLPPLGHDEAAAVTAILDDLPDRDFVSPWLRRMLVASGVGYHSAALLPAEKDAVERLGKVGLLRFIVGTTTLAMGIDFSVRTVVVATHQRPGAKGVQDFSDAEVIQMLGRAGRRGKEEVGYSVVPWHSGPVAFEREELRSALTASVDLDQMVALLAATGGAIPLRRLLERSFERFTRGDWGTTLPPLAPSRTVVEAAGAFGFRDDSRCTGFTTRHDFDHLQGEARRLAELVRGHRAWRRRLLEAKGEIARLQRRSERARGRGAGLAHRQMRIAQRAFQEADAALKEIRRARQGRLATLERRAAGHVCADCPVAGSCRIAEHEIRSHPISGHLLKVLGHLQRQGFCDDTGRLNPLGETAAAFGGTYGGLYLARRLAKGKVTPENLLDKVGLLGALAGERWESEIGDAPRELTELYPEHLSSRYRRLPGNRIRFAGYGWGGGELAKRWLAGEPWASLVADFVEGGVMEGDLVRTLQQLTDVAGGFPRVDPAFRAPVLELRRRLLQPPVVPADLAAGA
ncbi:MAG: DEAD/DEAH box helicase [Nitrospirota bacterium]